MSRRLLVAAAVVAVLAGGCGPAAGTGTPARPPVPPSTSSTPTPSPTSSPAPTPSQTSSSPTGLDGLTVAAETHADTYDRAAFGTPWADVDHNHCDTRDDILKRDLTAVTFRSGGCIVATGTLADPYTGRTIGFVRGVSTSAAVQIDHIVALGLAWRDGAWAWTPTQRLAYANDPRVLLAVDGPANEAKGDDSADEWTPPNRADDCDYGRRYVAILTVYRLTVTVAEKAALARLLATCPA